VARPRRRVGDEARPDRRAHARGVKRLVTESQHENLPMPGLNEKFGYGPTIANIVYRGPLLAEHSD
jgi:hypothetical protein